VYASATEGISKAWISNISAKKDTATAIGTFTAFQSICTMLASSIAGLIWYNFSANATFIITGIGTIGIIVYFLLQVRVSDK
jgi:predicted MFS family arabinose efflux permease